MDVIEVVRRFSTKRKCILHLERIRWNKSPVCSYCGSSRCTKRKNEYRYHCNQCNRSFSVTVGTIFHDTHLPLPKWFLAIALVLNAKKGVSSRQLARDLGVDKNTAWYVQMRLRRAMKESDTTLEGIIEADETYIGGDLQNKTKKYRKQRDKQGWYRSGMEHKVPVLGMLQRGGKVINKVLPKAHGVTIKPILKQVISKGSTLITDGFGGYHRLDQHFASHQIINHTQDEYVRGDFHLNTLEGFWSLLKRGILGQYHSVTSRHLQLYVDEFSFRYVHREDPHIFERLLSRSVHFNSV